MLALCLYVDVCYDARVLLKIQAELRFESDKNSSSLFRGSEIQGQVF